MEQTIHIAYSTDESQKHSTKQKKPDTHKKSFLDNSIYRTPGKGKPILTEIRRVMGWVTGQRTDCRGPCGNVWVMAMLSVLALVENT